uniref:Uncharacterized protein n=1 Tax=Caenorhabditis japonica TaxID=281687 RepID=A0A8R1IVN1_CAEJA
MSAWLRNIQGQLSDLANEVLNEANDVLAEAREEVADPDAELLVAKKKCAEAEKQLAIEAAKCESLSGEKKHLEEQLYDAHVEMDAIGQKLNGMVRQRDEEIKKLKVCRHFEKKSKEKCSACSKRYKMSLRGECVIEEECF